MLKRNASFKNRFQGDEIFIVANGPSLNNFGPENLQGRKVIVMNHFELAPWKSNVKIVAHCIGEPVNSPAWEDPTPSIDGTEAMSYWLHVSALRNADVRATLGRKSLHFVKAIIKPDLWSGRAPDLTRSTLAYQTTAQLAISVALYMGFKAIYLVGFDHDWLTTRGHSPHFYAESDEVKPSDLSIFSYYEMMLISLNMWRIYFALQRSANNAGARILNLSDPSYLDVFERRAKPDGPL